MRNLEKNTNRGLQLRGRRANVRASGVTTLTSIGSRSVNSAHDSRNFYKTESLCFDFGLEGSRKAGVYACTFVTPQALFCARDKARKRITKILTSRGASNDLPTHVTVPDPGSRRAAERGHEIHPETAAHAIEDRRGSRVAFPQSARSQEIAARHEIHRGVSHQRHRVHSVHLPDAVTGAGKSGFPDLSYRTCQPSKTESR